MSTESPAQAASADLARTNAGLAQNLSGVALPELSQMMAVVRRELGSAPGQEPAGIKQAYAGARTQLNEGYNNARTDTLGLLQQQALQSGQRFLPGQVNAIYGSAMTNLEQDRSAALKRLQYGEAQAGLSEYNQLLNLMGVGTGTALNLGKGFAGQQASAIGGLSQSSQFGSALGGAASGASLGSAFGGWGALAGGVLGGAYGALASG